MHESKVKREVKVEGENIRMISDANEVMTKDVFFQTYYIMQMKLNQMNAQLEQARTELAEEIEETEDLKKFAEMLEKSKKIVKRKEAIHKIQELEKNIATATKELEDLKPTFESLQHD